ncbi:phytase [Polymorphobacter fuscus]|uniref:Phytase n=1 Tax=Sandarakinorhabdus fusca TaxID=1439888 RepID=A0A7C9GPQ9_9SPHN|nr:phytase [Polymorphobacter fuscus]KAB7646526.1 phytase [Polymorphobacter fuscus]MQT17772.1 phytase [Polymorphobacter fuscus]NJC09680.1 3-phytase [Polymorphobacter fuscus]
MRSLLLPLALLAGCATVPAPTPAPTPSATLPTAVVTASGETAAVATANADAADDPAVWRNAADPAASLIIGTDKKAGLYVYGLDGKVRDFSDAGRVNNVDVANHKGRAIVAASDRNDNASAHVALFGLDPATAKLTVLGRVPAGAGEAYGLCLYAAPDALYAFVVLKDGTINQLALDLSGPAPSARIVRTMKLGTQSEGCVVDPRTRRLYVAEEDVGLWRFDARAGGATTPVKIAAADGREIVADAEGVAIAAEGRGNGGYLVVSSQGDNAYAVYRLSDDRYVGRFRIGAGAFGATSETDGIEIATGNFGPQFPGGLMIAQDGDNAPAAQNFKLVDWRKVKAALGLR